MLIFSSARLARVTAEPLRTSTLTPPSPTAVVPFPSRHPALSHPVDGFGPRRYLLLLFNVPATSGHGVVGRASGNVLVVFSLVTKLRFIPGLLGRLHNLGAADDQTALAIVEWSDVAVTMICVAKYIILNGQRYHLAVVATPAPVGNIVSKAAAVAGGISIAAAPPGGRPTTILTRFSSDTVAGLALIIGGATVAAAWAMAVRQGVVPKNKLPDINETFVHVPGDWFGRWGLVLTASCLTAIMIINHYMVSTTFGTTP